MLDPKIILQGEKIMTRDSPLLPVNLLPFFDSYVDEFSSLTNYLLISLYFARTWINSFI